MSRHRLPLLQQVAYGLAGLVIIKVTVAVVYGYRNYFPPNFDADFLRGREDHFFGPYQAAFYAHIASGPCALILGTILISERFRLRFPRWHRCIGRIQIALVLLLVAPSGLWMAWYAAAGPVAAAGFAVLAVLTGTTVAMGWRAAVQRRFPVHRRWMMRCYLLLCSAVTLRVTVGLATVLGVDWMWFDPVVSWASWLVPLGVYEWLQVGRGYLAPRLLTGGRTVIDVDRSARPPVGRPGAK
ncbi:MAG TPA: DUF2306 domain-containing protein [Planctomycetaceae bacterium]|nr:DUF2306 domain-containing protein [Planctomycetaceae bacterium]